jgi:hypothetical protein
VACEYVDWGKMSAAGPSEHGNKPLYFVKWKEILEQVNYYQLPDWISWFDIAQRI